MAIICVGDLHIQKRNLNIFKEFREKFITYLKEPQQRDIDTIVILGDVLHTMNIVNIHCLNIAVQFFKDLDDLNIKIMIIVGNHDYIGPNEYLSKNHWMNVISLFNPRNITIVDHVIRYKDNIYLPYVPVGKFAKALDTVDLTGVKYIFCHQEFLGSVYEFGNVVSENGDEWTTIDTTTPITIISGHIHKKQWVSNKNIYYTGTPYQTRFNESPDKTISLIRDDKITEIYLDLPKMITIYTSVKDNLDFVFNPNDLYKIVVRVDSIEQSRNFLKSTVYKKLKSSATVIFEYPKNSIVDIPLPNDAPPNFKQILFDKIKHSANMKMLFDKVI